MVAMGFEAILIISVFAGQRSAWGYYWLPVCIVNTQIKNKQKSKPIIPLDS